MTLITRMARLFTADVHAVLDRIEEPDVLLKQAVREMEDELARSEREARALEHEQHQLAARQRKARADLVELGEQLDACFQSGNDALARTVIKRRLETERIERHVGERLAALERELAARRAALADERDQLELMRQKAEILTTTPADGGLAESGFAVADADVEVALLRERQKRQRS